MKRSERSPYTRIATEADRQVWSDAFAPSALVGFVQVTESNVTHWAAIIRGLGFRNKHDLHRLCDYYRKSDRPTPTAEVNCMTCIVRIERGPGAPR